MENKLTKKYGLLTAICMVVGIVIGSGVFFKAQTVLQKTGGDMPLGIIAWIIGGLVMIFCVLAFGSMAQKYEKVNGIVDYAEATIGKKYGYLLGWFLTTIYYPTMTVALAWLSARYSLEFIRSVAPDFPLLALRDAGGAETILGPECIILTLFFLVAAYAMNALSPKIAGKFQVSTTFIKLIPLCLMAVVGIIYGLVNGTLANNFANAAEGYEVSGNPLFAAVCSTVFAYEGWIIATSINAELKDSKKNLPKALTIGGIIIMAIYIFYYVGVAGGATNQTLADKGATSAFTNVFGNVLGNILNLFIAISCMGTLNGLMMGCSRGMYSLAVRGNGPAPETFGQVDKATNSATNSSIFGLLACAAWGVYFYLSNLAGTWSGIFVFDPTEIPIVTIYAMYLPIFIAWMVKEKDEGFVKRFLLPILAFLGSAFMVLACIISHKMACVWYLIVFAVIMAIGAIFMNSKKNSQE
ncbi:MAG: APC family permease [Oscillospiraceae bacterium]|nr:APC family permease [Oscillospiraceae bacterium]